jgi:hypothetical protein
MSSKPQAIVWSEGIGKLSKIVYSNGYRTRDFPAFSIAPEPLCYHLVPKSHNRLVSYRRALLIALL